MDIPIINHPPIVNPSRIVNISGEDILFVASTHETTAYRLEGYGVGDPTYRLRTRLHSSTMGIDQLIENFMVTYPIKYGLKR